MISFQCPHCAAILRTTENETGRQFACPICSAEMIVPDAESYTSTPAIDVELVTIETPSESTPTARLQPSRSGSVLAWVVAVGFVAVTCAMMWIVFLLALPYLSANRANANAEMPPIGVEKKPIISPKEIAKKNPAKDPKQEWVSIKKKIDDDRREFDLAQAKESHWIEQVVRDLQMHEQRIRDKNERVRKIVATLSETELIVAKRRLDQLKNLHSLTTPTPTIAVANFFWNDARQLDPRFVEVVRREMVVQSAGYPRLLASGDVTKRLPWQKRKEIFDNFKVVIGEPTLEWSLLVPFDDLSANDMGEIGSVINNVPFRDMSQRQRRLLLDAGAIEYFKKEAGIK